jgi:hypothetical protein
MAVFGHNGFASVSMDTGNLSVIWYWALNRPQSIVEWEWLAMHRTVDTAKQINSVEWADLVQDSYYAAGSASGPLGQREILGFPEVRQNETRLERTKSKIATPYRT